ncbi:MAG: hypothetical protein ACOYME_00235 [Prochlorotrichaceae cyanobacterium]
MSRVAIIVGIEQYQHFPLLLPAGEGANAIAQRLSRYGEFSVHRLQGDRKAGMTLGALESILVRLFKPSQGKVPQTVLFYFSGYVWSKNEGVPETFLTTTDTTPQGGVGGLSLFWLKRLLQESRVPQWTVILDGWTLPEAIVSEGNSPSFQSIPDTHPGSGESFSTLNFAEGNPGSKPGYDRLYLAACHPPQTPPFEGYSLLTQAILEGLDPYRFETGVITSGFVVNWLRMALEAKVIAPHFQESGRPIVLTRSPEEVCPYKGLSYFDCNTEDPQHFFGREDLTQDLLDRIQHQSFLPILGASGCGKSSVLRAGLVYQLQEGRLLPGSDTWQLRVIQPGSHPLLNLAFAFLDLSLPLVDRAKQLGEIEAFLVQGATGMRRLVQVVGATRLVIAVDQFEEVFTLCHDRGERQTFLDCLLGALNQDSVPLQVVITLRSDFLAVCSRPEYGELGTQIRRYQVAVPPMTPAELRRAITEPALRSGVAIEAELVDQLISEVDGAPGSLPLLEHTLTELWKQRTETGLKTRQYVRWGGIRGSLQSRANAVFHQLTPEQKLAAQHIFLALTQFGDGVTEDSRRRVFKQDLMTRDYSSELINLVLQRLADEKLVVTSQWAPPGTGLGEEMVVDVIHESLIRHWDLLRQWVNDNRTVLRQQRSLEDLAQQWFRKGKTEDYLIQGRPLEEALSFWQGASTTGQPTATAASRLAQEFLEACQAKTQAQEAQQHQQQQQLQYQSDRVRQAGTRFWATVVMGGATLVGACFFIVLQLRAAELQSIRGLRPAQDGISNTLETRLASVTAADRFAHSLWQIWSPDRTLEQQILENLQQSRYGVAELNRLVGHTGAIVSVAISPDGSKIATTGRDGTAKLWNWDGAILAELNGHQGLVSRVAFSPDGQRLATAGDDRTVRLWDLNGQQRLKLDIPTGNTGSRAISLAFSPTQSEFATGSADGQIRRWDFEGNLRQTFPAHNGAIYDLTYSPDGTRLASSGGDGVGQLWTLKGESLAVLTGHDAIVSGIAFSPDGQTLATSDFKGQVRLWTSTGQFRRSFTAHSGTNPRILGLDFSADSQILGTSSTDGTARLWTMEGLKIGEFQGHQDWVYGLAFDPKNDRFVTAGREGLARIWNIKPKPQSEILAHPDRILSVATSALQGRLATGSTDGSILLWTVDGQPLSTLQGHRGWVLDLEYNTAGDQLVSAGSDGTLQLWQVKESQSSSQSDRQTSSQTKRTQVINTNQGWVYEVHFSPDGQKLVSRGRDGSIKLWDLEGQLLAQFTGHQGSIYAVKFSPNGQILATRGRDSTVRLWDLEGNPLAGLRNHQGEIYDMGFLPSGDRVVTAGADGTVRFWTLNGQPLTVLRKHGAEVYSVAISPDGAFIATASADRSIRLWDTEGTLLQTFTGHEDAVWEVKFSADGQTLVSRSSDGTVRLWNLEGTPISTLRGFSGKAQSQGQVGSQAGNVYSVDFSGGSDRLVTTSADGQLRFWNRDAKLLRQWQDPQGAIYRLAADPQGKLVATAGADGIAQLWSTEAIDGKNPSDPQSPPQPVATLEGHQGPIWQITFSPKGDSLATTSADGTVRLWSRSGEFQSSLTYPEGEIYSVTFSPNGQEIATASSDGVVRRWNLEGLPLSTIQAHKGAAFSVAYNPQGDQLVSGGADAIVHLWSLNGEPLQTLTGQQDQIFDVTFNTKGDRIASAGADGTARLWDSSGNLLAELRGHVSPVWRVTFSPPSSDHEEQILTSGADGTSRLWNALGQPIAVIPTHSLGTYDSVFSANGQDIFTGGLDGQLRSWTIAPLDQLLTENCDQLSLYFNNPQIQNQSNLCKR